MMHRGKPNRFNRCRLLLGLGLALLWGAAGCSRQARIAYQIYPDVELRPDRFYRSQACRETIEHLLSKIWESGFFHDDAELLEEILNNDYGIFEYQNCPEGVQSVRAFYIEDTEQVMLNRDLFRNFKFAPRMGFTLTDLDRRIKATLVHELLHDLWFNRLNDEKKSRFSAEAEHFYAELIRVASKQDKLLFLIRAGYGEPRLDEFAPFEEFKRLRERYPDAAFFGTELFAVLGDRTFSGQIRIPRCFRTYYQGILSDRVLEFSPF